MKRYFYLMALLMSMFFAVSCDDFWDEQDPDYVLSDDYFEQEFYISDDPLELKAILDDALDYDYHGTIYITIEGLCDESDFWEYALLWNRFDQDGNPLGVNGIYNSLSIDINIAPDPHLTMLGDYMFSRCEALVGITIPDGVMELGYGCLRGTSITSLRLPRSLHYIGEDAVSRTLLKEIDLRYVTRIGRASFAHNSDMRRVWFCNDLEEIPQDAFYKCDLQSVDLPRYIRYIGRTAFAYNYIPVVDFPESLEYLGENVFEYNDLMDVYFYGRVDEIYNLPANTLIHVPERNYNYYRDLLPRTYHSMITTTMN